MCEENKNLNESESMELNIADVRKHIIDYTNWLCKQDLMISEGINGYTFRSSRIGGEKYSAKELCDKFVSEYIV